MNDAENGDEVEQVDRRTFFGAKASYRVMRNLGPVRFDTTIGADVRNDDIHNELWNTRERVHLANVHNNDVHEVLGGIFINEEISPIRWLRLNIGGRADLISFAIDDVGGGTNTDVGGATQFSPKVSLVLTPLERESAQLDLYANYGHGFHSNDVRGAFLPDPVSPLSRAVGAEVGSRAHLFKRWDIAAAVWRLELGNETVWVGDEGNTAVNGPTLRYGVELETRFEITSWLAADLDVARAGVRFYGIGDRPASDDGELIAPGFTQFDVHLGYRHRWFDVALDIENLFNGNGGFGGCEDVAFTPAYPFTARVTATVYFD